MLTGELPSAKCMCTALTRPSLCHGQKLPSYLNNVLPSPANSAQYMKHDIFGLLAAIQNPYVYSLEINQVIGNKFVPASRLLLYELLQKHNRNGPILGVW
eukprot:8846097-Ditylum_brightwellii.AAC.1